MMSIPIWPARPVKAKPPKQASVMLVVFLALSMAALAVGLAWWLLPPLFQDFALRNNVEPAQAARLTSGSCKSKLILYMCNTEIQHRVGQDIRTTSQGFSFLGFYFGSLDASVVQQRGNPEVVTTTLALDNIWSRILTTLPIVVAFGFLAVALLAAIPSTIGLSRRFKDLNRGKLIPLAVDVYGYRDKNSDRIWSYGGPDATRDKPYEILMPPTSSPFFLNDECTQALAVVGERGRQPLLLDQALAYLKITDKERAELIAWRQALADRIAPRL